MEMPIAKDGSRYVITFTDDYSRGSWAYAMKWKHEALQKFRQFEAWVHRQFGAHIKRFLTDNGREYLPIGTHLETRESSLTSRRHTAKGRMVWSNERIALSGSGSTRSCPMRDFLLPGGPSF
ncbi:hypothetical protein VN97_g13178 [Penicillium thymicola]|uniref:Integrase catalytic domain-containing protein n=1 Tax=Penicillium thymicola TaxID=293382 RepID=A0AAI9X1U6_PENTH|nr:hypothetical protein VN97_g13178 [Penicillium thymicola]